MAVLISGMGSVVLQDWGMRRATWDITGSVHREYKVIELSGDSVAA